MLGLIITLEEKEPVDLASVITPESMVPILANKEVQERLIPHLPEGSSLPKSEEELRNTISTPQFQQVSVNVPVNTCKSISPPERVHIPQRS